MSDVQLADFICCVGTFAADCGFCGRMHYAVGVYSSITDEQRENYAVAAKNNPDKYFESPDDSIAFGMWDGRQVVWGCPCGKLKRYEDFFWENRAAILGYIKARNDANLAEANRTTELMKGQPQ